MSEFKFVEATRWELTLFRVTFSALLGKSVLVRFLKSNSFSSVGGDNKFILFSLELGENVQCGSSIGGVEIGSFLIGRGGGIAGGIKGTWGRVIIPFVVVEVPD